MLIIKKELAHVKLTEKVIGSAISVHKDLGPGFLEKIYEHALCIELERRGIVHQRQVSIPIFYKKKLCGQHRLDLVIENKVVVELKAAKAFEDIHFAIVLSYLKASELPVALLLNYAESTLAIRRFGNRIFQTGETRNTGERENLVRFLRDESR